MFDRKKYYQENRDIILEKRKKYTEENKESIKKYQKVYAQRPSVKEASRKRARKYYKNNKDVVLKKVSRYRKNNRKKINTYNKEYKKNNYDKITFCQKRSRIRSNMTYEEYCALRSKQNNLCAICGGQDKTKALALDHCHTSGKIRGLLCGKCNRGIGLLGDNIKILQKAIEYLS